MCPSAHKKQESFGTIAHFNCDPLRLSLFLPISSLYQRLRELNLKAKTFSQRGSYIGDERAINIVDSCQVNHACAHVYA